MDSIFPHSLAQHRSLRPPPPKCGLDNTTEPEDRGKLRPLAHGRVSVRRVNLPPRRPTTCKAQAESANLKSRNLGPAGLSSGKRLWGEAKSAPRLPLLQARVSAPGCGASRGEGAAQGSGGSRCCSLARRAHRGSGDQWAPPVAFPAARRLSQCPARLPPRSPTLPRGSRWSPSTERNRRPPPKHEEGVRREPPTVSR